VQLEIRKLLQPKLPAIQMVHVRDILINIRPQGQLPAPNDHMHSLKEAQAISSQILIRLKKGENFAKLASHYSEDIANNSSGGDIGIVTNISGVGTTAAVRAFGRDPNFSNAIFSMQVGQISSSPIQSVFGLHIVDILSTSDKPLSSDTSLYEQEYQVAQSAQLQNASHDYLNQLASSANIAFRQFGHDCVYRLIVNQVIEDEAKSKNITASDQELEAQIKKTLDKNPGVTLDSMLSQTNSTMEDFRLQMRLQVLVNKLISTTFAPFKIVHIRHIALFVHWPGAKAPANAHQYSPKDADVLASSIIRKLGAGASFQSLAGQYSEDTTTSQTSGDLGYITGKDHYEPAFLVAAMKLKPLEFTKSPVRTSYGYEIIQAISTSDQHPKSENSAYANAQQKAKDLEVAAEMHDYIPSLIARHKVINNILN
jgi:parvulin-like peptidyl-prolyl isomerase